MKENHKKQSMEKSIRERLPLLVDLPDSESDSKQFAKVFANG